MFKLTELSAQSYPGCHRVSADMENPLHWDQFMADVQATRNSICSVDRADWALFESDTYRFVVGLLALLAENKVVYLPAENHAGIVSALRDHAVEFLGEFPTDTALDVVSGPLMDVLPALKLRGKIVVFTSGSTGAAKPIEKSLAQLDAELASLEQRWAEQLQQSLIVGTVSHQHLYGLLFLVMWPLCAGRCFWRKPFVDPAIMAATASHFPAVAWVMSPAHLQRLDAGMPWASVRESTTAVFSSGAPLQQRAAQAVFDGLGQYPHEVLGSSETGGIASRQQRDMSTPWHPLAGVKVKLDGAALAVCSQWLPDEQWHITSDQAVLTGEGGFLLGGRMDRIAKIEGKRVALLQVEAEVEKHPWIEACAVTVLHRRRQCLGAVVTLSPIGEREFSVCGHHLFTRALRTFLCERLAAAALPRVWRIVAALPRNSQGKVLQQDIEKCFVANVLPPVLNRQDDGAHGCRLVLQIDDDNPYFDGHFSQMPILPGVVQVFWAQLFAQQVLALKGEFSGLQAIKFKEAISPLMELTLRLEFIPATGELHYQYDSQRGRHSQGTLLYHAPPD